MANEVKIAEEEMKKKLENSSVGKSEEKIPTLDVKDYKDSGTIDFYPMFSDFYPDEEEMTLEVNFLHDDDKDIFNPPVVPPIIEPSFMKSEKWMETDPPKEIKSGDGEPPPVNADTRNWDDLELMKWLWQPYSYEEYLRFYNQG